MGELDLEIVTAQNSPYLIGFVGGHDAGKTTLLPSLCILLWQGTAPSITRRGRSAHRCTESVGKLTNDAQARGLGPGGPRDDPFAGGVRMSGGRNHLRGRRVQIVGSASARTDVGLVGYAHDVVRGLSRQVLSSGGGLVLGAGREPRGSEGGPALTFDWTALEEVAAWFSGGADPFPRQVGPPVVVVLSEKGEGEIPAERLWRELLATGRVHVETIHPGLRSAALLRQRQADYGDILFALGGGNGVEHSAELFLSRNRAVLPLDLDLGASREDGTGGARRLAREARAEPDRFLRLAGGSVPVSAQLARLATCGGAAPAADVVDRTAQLPARHRTPACLLRPVAQRQARVYKALGFSGEGGTRQGTVAFTGRKPRTRQS